MNSPAEEKLHLDCRGLRCPEPILHIAKAARGLQGRRARITIHADDAVFPMDLKAWARSAKAEVVSVERDDSASVAFYEAVLIVNAQAPQAPAAAPPQAASSAPADKAERAAQAASALQSALAAKAAQLAAQSPEASPEPAPTGVEPSSQAPSSQASSPQAPSSPNHAREPHRAPSPSGAQALTLDLRGLTPAQRDARLDGLQAASLSAGTLVAVLLEDQAALPSLMQWCVQGGHPIRQLALEASPLRVDLTLGQPSAPSGPRACLLLMREDRDALTTALTMARGLALRGDLVELCFFGEGVRLLRATSASPGSRGSTGTLEALASRLAARLRAPSAAHLLRACAAAGARFYACEDSIAQEGLATQPLLALPGLTRCPSTQLLERARRSPLGLTL